ncbi:hypothetical protein WJX84_010873, partial [Apatococcus fuscideae]
LFGKVSDRFQQADVAIPRVEVRFEALTVEASVNIGARALPNVVKAYWEFIEGTLQTLHLWPGKRAKFTILNAFSGALCPGRLTLLLGPPGGGKSTLLKALAGKSDGNVKVHGRVSYNGQSLSSFTPQRASCYVDQYDTHLSQLTVRETLDFSARCYGIGAKSELLDLVRKREQEQGIMPDWSVDAYMSNEVKPNQQESIVTELYLRLLGLDVCADTMVGNQMVRGISGGQKKRVTSGEMMVAPGKVLLMDEISTGLDSSTTFQIVRALQDFAHLQQATVMIALLQPPEETYRLFDDIMLLSDGLMVFFGPASEVMPFFNSMGFALPPRKGVPDFLQEVTSRKDQQQYWAGMGRPSMPVSQNPSTPSNSLETALPTSTYALSGLDAFRACLWRELILSQREMFVYKFKTFQIAVTGIITATLFLRTHLHPETQMRLCYIRAPSSTHCWSCCRMACLRWPSRLNACQCVVWTAFTYWVIGFAPTASRFFIFFLFAFLMHFWSITIFCLIGACCRNMVVANSLGAGVLLLVLLTAGFTIAKDTLHPWWVWFAWCNPMFYAQRGIAVNEFLAPRWQTQPYPADPTMTLGNAALMQRSFPVEQMWVWIGVGCLIGFSILFIILNMLAHAFLAGNGRHAANVSKAFLEEREAAIHGAPEDNHEGHDEVSQLLSKPLSQKVMMGRLTADQDSPTSSRPGSRKKLSAKHLNSERGSRGLPGNLVV